MQNKVRRPHQHSTLLHLLGLNHSRFTYWYVRRNFRLTDVYGKVVKDIITGGD